MSKVFVLDTKKRPLQPCHPARARQLLRDGKAAVFRRYPFTIILKREVPDVAPSSLRLKIDPGSRVTGLAIADDKNGRVVFAAELSHRGQQIQGALLSRRQLRRARRSRKTRYRKPRFSNRRRPEGWLPPSLASRVANVETWVKR
ncbi:MAG: HNH endonuclease, partial [Firmicutes bacterium]|nr:HNH endonuclease [Bacillota bacterium]